MLLLLKKRLQYFVGFFVCVRLVCVLLLFIFCRCSYFAFQIKSASKSGRHAVFHISIDADGFQWRNEWYEQKTASQNYLKLSMFGLFFGFNRMQLRIMLQWLRATTIQNTHKYLLVWYEYAVAQQWIETFNKFCA